MKVKENAKNDEVNHQADALTDLAVADEQADETKGGAIQRGGAGDDVLIGGFGSDWLSGGTGRD